MVTFVIVLAPAQLENPDTDLSVLLPELVEGYSKGRVQAEGWGYAPDESMHFFFQASSRKDGLQQIVSALKSARVKGNDLSSVPVAFRAASEGPFTTLHPPARIGEAIGDIGA
jgi:hypothetical protein